MQSDSSNRKPSDLKAPAGLAARVGIAIALLLIPLMLLILPLPPTKGKWAVYKQDWILAGALAVAGLSLAAYLIPSPLFPQRRSTLPLIMLGTALLLASNVVWNKAFRDYVTTHDYRREVFRRVMHTTFHWPIYGRYDNAIARWDPDTGRYGYATLPWVIVSIGIAATWFAWARRRPLEKRWDVRSFAILLSLQLALIVAFALCEPWPTRLSLNISGYAEFKRDIPAFSGIADTLRNYVSKMPPEKELLHWYGQHYPPGNLILLQVEQALGVAGFAKSIVTLLTVLSAIPLYLLARELELDPVARSATLLTFTATTGVLVFSTINTTSLVLFPTVTCLWLLVRGMRSGSTWAAIGLGLAFTFYLFFSFSASILGLLMAFMALLAWWSGAVTTRNLLRTGVISLAAVGAAIAVVYLTTRFNLVACFITAVRGHQTQQGNEGFDDLRRYLLRSTGNLIAYLMSIVPLSILAFSGMRHGADQHPMARALALGLGLTVVFAAFSGLFYVETERIWIFLTPAFALVAGAELARRSQVEGRRIVLLIFFLVLLISSTQEFFFMHYR